MWDIAAVFVISCCLLWLVAPLFEGTTIEEEPAPEEPHRIGARCRRNGPNDGHEYRRNAQGDLYCIREDCDEYISQVSA